MATQIQWRRGTTAQTASFTGAVGEATVDTSKNTLVIHDGTTAGGFPLARESALSANAIYLQASYNQANASFIAANSAGVYANGAFVSSNTIQTYVTSANANINLLFSYVNTANANITAAVANITAAFAAANAATATDTTQNNSITAAFTQANTGVNNALSASNYANGAFTSSNTIQTYVTSANANISLLFSYVNTANANITAAFSNITAAFAAANAATATDTTQNTSITAAFTAANSAGVYANGAFVVANSATNTATAAYTRANNSINANTGGTITGSLTISQDLTVSGNVFITGNATTISANNIIIDDSLIYLANNNVGNASEIGFIGHFTSTKYQHTGLVRDHIDAKWKLFSNVSNEPVANTITWTDAVYDTLKVGTIEADTANIGGINLYTFANNAYTIANSAYVRANNSLNANTGGTIAGPIVVDGGAYGNVTTTQFASVWGQAYGPNAYSIMQVRSSDFYTGIGISAYATNGPTLYSSNNIIFRVNATVRDKDFPTGGTFAASIAANGAFIAQASLASTSNTTGSIQVTGGVGVTGNVYADSVYINNVIAATIGDALALSIALG